MKFGQNSKILYVIVWFCGNSETEVKTINEWKRLWSQEWKRLWSDVALCSESCAALCAESCAALGLESCAALCTHNFVLLGRR